MCEYSDLTPPKREAYTNGLLLSRGAALTKRAAAIVKKIVDLNMTEVVR